MSNENQNQQPMTGESIISQVNAEIRKAEVSEVRKTVKVKIQEYNKLKRACESALDDITATLEKAGLSVDDIKAMF